MKQNFLELFYILKLFQLFLFVLHIVTEHVLLNMILLLNFFY